MLMRIRETFTGERGLSLMELVVALGLLLIIIPVATALFVLGSRSFAVGDVQSELQQHVRMVAEYVVQEIRYAHWVEIGDVGPDAGESEQGFLYVQDGSVMHREAGSDESTRILHSLPENVHFSLQFEPGTSGDDMLRYEITGHLSGREHTVSAEVRVMNADQISGAESGTVVAYTSPRPASGAIKAVRLLDRETEASRQEHRWSLGEDLELEIDVATVNIPDGTDVHLNVERADEEEIEGIYIDPTVSQIVSDSLNFEFWISIYDRAPPGLYHFVVSIPDDPDQGVKDVVSVTRAFIIWPDPEILVRSNVDDQYSVITIDFTFETSLQGAGYLTIEGWHNLEGWLSGGAAFSEDDFEVSDDDKVDLSYEGGVLTLKADDPHAVDFLTVSLSPPEDEGWVDTDLGEVVDMLVTRSVPNAGEPMVFDFEFTIQRGH